MGVYDEDSKKPCCLVASILIIVVSIVIATTFDVVGYEQVGLMVNEFSYKVVDKKAFETGSHATGLGRTFILFKKTIHITDMRASGGAEKQSENIGSASSNPDGGPITIRTIDGQMIDIEVSVQYTLNTEKLYELYVRYGLKYNDFATSILRSKCRDVAANFKANVFFENRLFIQESMRKALESALSKAYFELNGFQLLNVFLPKQLENTIKNIQTSRLSVALKTTQLITTKIKAETELAVKKEQATTEKMVAQYLAETRNTILKKQQQLEMSQQETLTQVQKQIKVNEKEILVKDAETEALIANATGAVDITTATTAKMLMEISTAAAKKQAVDQKSITAIKSVAAANAFAIKSNGTSVAKIAESNALSIGYTNMVSETSFAANDINHLEWTDFFAKHPSKKMHMDLSQPNALYLDAQQATNANANMQSSHDTLWCVGEIYCLFYFHDS